MDPVSGTFAGFSFSPILLSGSSGGIAVNSCSVLALYPRFLISACGVFSFVVSYAYFVLVFVLPSFIHAESVREFDLLACCFFFPLGFLRYLLL